MKLWQLLPTATKTSFVLGAICLVLIPFFWSLAIPLAIAGIFFFTVFGCCCFFDPRGKDHYFNHNSKYGYLRNLSLPEQERIIELRLRILELYHPNMAQTLRASYFDDKNKATTGPIHLAIITNNLPANMVDADGTILAL